MFRKRKGCEGDLFVSSTFPKWEIDWDKVDRAAIQEIQDYTRVSVFEQCYRNMIQEMIYTSFEKKDVKEIGL